MIKYCDFITSSKEKSDTLCHSFFLLQQLILSVAVPVVVRVAHT